MPDDLQAGSRGSEVLLLAVDAGLRTGLAAFSGDGRLLWYRSHNLGTAARLRRAAQRVLGEHLTLAWVVVEGGGSLAQIWFDAAVQRGAGGVLLSAETWRELLLPPRKRRTGHDAKEHAIALAREVIAWSQAKAPTSLRHDTAEAILAGLWGAVAVRLLATLPPLPCLVPSSQPSLRAAYRIALPEGEEKSLDRET